MNGNILLVPIVATFIGGIITLFIPKKVRGVREIIAIAVLIFTFIISVRIFTNTRILGSIPLSLNILGTLFNLLSTPLSSFIVLIGVFLTLLVTIYSMKGIKDNPRINEYYTYLLWSLTATLLTVLSNNFIMLLVVWGAIAVLLYFLIMMGKPGAEKASYKALVMIGGSDVLMLIGAGIIYYLAGTFAMNEIRITLNSPLSVLAFILLMIGALTKAGVMPFHTWVTDSAEYAPTPVMALFPAALDKLLGIYLITRMVVDFFIVIPNSAMSILMMAIGSLTIIAAVLMAINQNDLLRLLSFITVSSAGYMILGVGTALPLGIIGGLFYMLNSTFFTTALFLSAGAVESQTKTTKLVNLGGLARFMPITFLTTFIGALAISGIPPLNGFTPKWLIYQSLIQIGNPIYGRGWYFIIFIIVAMFGSVLTLAALLKVLHSVFLEQKPELLQNVKEVSWLMSLPMLILTLICICFGIFAQFPLNTFLAQIFGFPLAQGLDAIAPYGVWSPGLATILMLLGIVIGITVYFFTRSRKVRTSEVFIGGESISTEAKPSAVSSDETTVPGTVFYDSIKKIQPISEAYRIADTKFFDIYEQARKMILLLTNAGRKIHNGLLQTYLGWLLLGAIAIIVTFLIIFFK